MGRPRLPGRESDGPETVEPGDPDWIAALERLRGAYADSTLSWCRQLFGYFLKWCRERGCDPFPADPKVVAAYVDHRFAAGLRAHAVLGEIYCIRRVMQALDYEDPTITYEVKLAIRRGKRTFGIRRRQVPPINAPCGTAWRRPAPRTPWASATAPSWRSATTPCAGAGS